MLEFAMNQDYYKKFLQLGPSNIIRSLKIAKFISIWTFHRDKPSHCETSL